MRWLQGGGARATAGPRTPPDLAYGIVAPPEDLEARVVARIPRREAGRRVPSWVAAVAAVFCVLAVIVAPDLSGTRPGRGEPEPHRPRTRCRRRGQHQGHRREHGAAPRSVGTATLQERAVLRAVARRGRRTSKRRELYGRTERPGRRDAERPELRRFLPQVGVTAEYDKDPPRQRREDAIGRVARSLIAVLEVVRFVVRPCGFLVSATPFRSAVCHKSGPAPAQVTSARQLATAKLTSFYSALPAAGEG